MDWLVFGDDWGAHPSTTQHLVRQLPPADRVVWIDSIGMRAPGLNAKDVRRAAKKLFRGTSRGPAAVASPSSPAGGPTNPRVVRPKIVPLHLIAGIRAVNGRLLTTQVHQALDEIGASRPVLLTSTPVAEAYLERLRAQRIIYLRLDDYAHFPGVDPRLVHHFEPRIMSRADAIVFTARELEPPDFGGKSHYLPQGVDWQHFASSCLEPPQTRVLGFFGLVSERIDHELVAAVASKCPGWTLQFVGNSDNVHPSLRQLANIEFKPAVPYANLPSVVATWRAAWIPYARDELANSVNPLKLREYLASGLPTLATPLPEIQELARSADIRISSDVHEIAQWLDLTSQSDSVEARRLRRDSMRNHSWRSRSEELRRIAAGAGSAG